MNPFSRVIAFCDRLLRALENLTGAIKDASNEKIPQSRIPDRISAEVRFSREIEEAQDAAQREQTRIQRRIALFTGLGFAAASIYAAIAFCQLRALKDQTTYAERAWVNANIVIAAPLDYGDDGAHIHLSVGGQNLGHTPASDVMETAFVTSFISQEYLSGKWDGQKYIEGLRKLRCPLHALLARTLLRDEPYRQLNDITFRKSDYTKSSSGDFFYPVVRYVVQYCTGFDDKVHTTVYDLILRRNPDEAGKKADAAMSRANQPFWPDEGTVPIDQITIYVSPSGGTSAD